MQAARNLMIVQDTQTLAGSQSQGRGNHEDRRSEMEMGCVAKIVLESLVLKRHQGERERGGRKRERERGECSAALLLACQVFLLP